MSTRLLNLLVSLSLSVASFGLRADILDHVPANAKLVVIAKDIQKLEQNLQAYAGKLDLPLDPAMIDLDALPGLVGMPVELGKQAALIVTDVTPSGVIILLELADPKSVDGVPGVKKAEDGDEKEEGQKEGEEEEDEDTDYTAEIMGMPAVIEVEGNLAKIQLGVTDDEGLEVVEEVKSPLSKGMTVHQKKLLAKSDLFFWVNVVEWRELAEQGLNMMQEQMQAAMEQAGADAQAAQVMPGMSIKGYFQFLFDGARTLTKETRSFYGGIAVDEADVHLLLAADYEPGSGMESAFAPVSVPVAELLKGLPNRDYAMVGAADMRGFRKAMAGFTEGVITSMFADAADDLKKSMKESMAYLDQTTTFSMLLEMAGDDGMEGVGLIMSDDPKGLFETYRKSAASGQQQMALLGMKLPKFEIVEKKIDGRLAFEYVMDMKSMLPAGDDLANDAADDAIAAMYGENLQMVYQVDLREKGLGYAMSGGKDPLQMLKSEKLLADDELVKRALQPLPAKGAAVTLIQPMGFVKFFSKLMEAQGLPALEVGDAEAVPPIASVIEIEKGMTALDLVVTAETTKSLVGFAMRAAQQAGAPPAEEMEDEEATDDEDDDDDDEGEDEKDEDQAEEEVEAGTP
jgi:hypothetical protein